MKSKRTGFFALIENGGKNTEFGLSIFSGYRLETS